MPISYLTLPGGHSFLQKNCFSFFPRSVKPHDYSRQLKDIGYLFFMDVNMDSSQ
jgi:hypothetical protein